MSSTSPSGWARTGPFSAGRILVIEPIPAASDEIVDVIGTAGFQTATADVARARTLVERLAPDLLVVLVDEPSPSLLRLCHWLRANGDTPLIAVTPRGADVPELLEAGVDIALRLPVGPFELVARVRSMLRRVPARSVHGDEMLGFGGLKLDRAERVLYVHDEAIALDRRHFLLIEALITNGTRITPRSLLESRLGVSGGALDRVVRRLRRRLEEIEGWRRIVSERSVGLRLLEDRPPPP